MAVGSSLVGSGYYSFWGRVFDMALDSTIPMAVGFLIGDLEDEQRKVQRLPIGTFFVLQVAPDPTVLDSAYTWMVTNRHVAEGNGSIRASVRRQSGELVTWDADDWVYPDDERLDLAIRPFDAPDRGPFTAVPSSTSFENIGEAPKAGTTVYFPGLLASPSARQMGAEGVPVVREGVVAARNQHGLWWTTSHLYEPRHWRWKTDPVHLIDVRSFGGFSGSPVFLQFHLPGPHHPDRPLPDAWAEMARAAGNDPKKLGDIHTITVWDGVFAAHIGESGIGIVIPSKAVTAFFSESGRLQQMQQERMKQSEHEAVEQGAKGQSASETEAGYQRQDFLDDLRAVTRRTDSEKSGPEASETEA